MSVLVVGISHRTAPVALLERVALDVDGVNKLLGAVVVVDVEVRDHGVDGLAGEVAQGRADRLDAAVEAVDVGVDLHAVAGGQNGGLLDVVGVVHRLGELLHAVTVEREALEQRDGGRVVGHPHDEDAHASTASSGSSVRVAGAAPSPARDLRCSW